MKVGPRYKVCKRLGSAIYDKCQTPQFALSEARAQKNRGRKGRGRNQSDFARQMMEKQRVRFFYGVSETQFRRYIADSVRSGVDARTRLLQNLETRLDNVVYRLGLAPTRRAARQMVSHGHIIVDGKRTTVPSLQVKAGTTFTVREGSKQKGPFTALLEKEEGAALPAWLSFDLKKYAGEIQSLPTTDSVELPFDLGQVLEFYSR